MAIVIGVDFKTKKMAWKVDDHLVPNVIRLLPSPERFEQRVAHASLRRDVRFYLRDQKAVKEASCRGKKLTSSLSEVFAITADDQLVKVRLEEVRHLSLERLSWTLIDTSESQWRESPYLHVAIATEFALRMELVYQSVEKSHLNPSA